MIVAVPDDPRGKAATRQRIVRAAARLFRERGYRETSVDQLMAEAGLTRGGFYAHFRDKAELLRAAITEGFLDASHKLIGDDELEGEAWVERARDRYLSRQHLGGRGRGCAAVALGTDISRLGSDERETFGAELDRLVDRMAERIGGPDARPRALELLSKWAGALMLARAVEAPELADEILAAARE